MYEILAGNTVIFSDITPATERKVIDPKLTMEDNCAGSLEFTLPPNNIIYDSIACLTTELMVTEDGNEIWRGRVISDSLDFWKNKRIVAEGELAYLNDSIQPPKKYLTGTAPSNPEPGAVYGTTVRSFLEALISVHNSQMGSDNNKKFTVGYVAPDLDGDLLADDDAINRFTNYESTLACVLEKLVDRLGGHLQIRHYGGVRYIDYLKDYIAASNQTIDFGSNLLEFSRNIDATEWVTAVIPRGERKEEEEIEGLEAYVTAADSTAATTAWHTKGSMIVHFPTNDTSYQTYGFICAVVDWENVTNPDTLISKAKKYLQAVQFNKMVLEVSAVDLHYLNPDIDSFKMLQEVTCTSEPHGMVNAKFPVTKMELDLNNPANTKYTLGSEMYGNISSAVNRFSNDVYNYIDDTHIPVESVVLNHAKANAKALVEGTLDGGYASFIYGTDSKGIPITESDGQGGTRLKNPDRPTGVIVQNTIKDNTATNRWLWSYGGLIHQKKSGGSWGAPNIGLTMDGSIVGDRITAGIINLTGAKSQSPTSHTGDPSGANTYVTDVYLNVYKSTSKTSANLIGRWSAEGIWIRKGQLQLGDTGNYGSYKTANGTSTSAKYPAEINDDGSAFFKYATLINGSKIGSLDIDQYGTLTNWGNNMAGLKIGLILNGSIRRSTFGISCMAGDYISGHVNTGSWNGISFGDEAYQRCHWGTSSFILHDGNEKNDDGWSQGGFFVVNGSPNQGDTGNYSKQVFNGFVIVRGGRTRATFDEAFYELVNDLESRVSRLED